MSLCDHTEVVGWGTVVRRNAADIVGYWRERDILEPACNRTEMLKYRYHAQVVVIRKLSLCASRNILTHLTTSAEARLWPACASTACR